MPQSLKQRLVGALVLFALAVLLLPALFEFQPEDTDFEVDVPPAPLMPEAPQLVELVGPNAEPLPDLAILPEGQASVTTAKAQAKVLHEAPLSAPEDTLQLDQEGAAVAWTLQLGTFGNAANAKRLVTELQADGLHAYQRDFRQKEGKVLSRVFVGPQVSRSELEAIAAKLAAERQLKGLILRYHP